MIIWFTYLFESAHKMKDFKGIPMGQFIFALLLWQFLFSCVVANYPQEKNQLVSKAVNIQRHLVDVPHFKVAGNVSSNKRAGNVSPKKSAGSVSPRINIATLKGNTALPIDHESHYRKRWWRSGKWLQGISNKNILNYDGVVEVSNHENKIDNIEVDREDKDNNDDNEDHNINGDSDIDNEENNEDNIVVDNDNDYEHNSDNDDARDKYDNNNDIDYDSPPHRIKPRGLGRIVTNKGRNRDKPVFPHIQSDKCVCGTYNPKEEKNLRIVNGVETRKNQYPWMVSIRYTDANHFCGGSIISDQFILTAAHCTYGMEPGDMQVTIGDHDLTIKDVGRAQTVNVKTIFDHPKYDDDTTNNDLSLLQLKKKIIFTWRTNPICLTPQDLTYYREKVTVMGWGMEHEDNKKGSPVLKHVQVKVLPMQKCRNDFRYERHYITSKMLCAYEQGKDACQGDSGGPLVWREPKEDRYFQIGATSWGIGCASKHHPGVYTKLTKFVDWIYDIAKDSTFCQTYIPKGAKIKKKYSKARLDKEQTEQMKAKQNEKENSLSEEEEGVQVIIFDEKPTTVNNVIIIDNNNANINTEQLESNGTLGNDTNYVINTTEKSVTFDDPVDLKAPNDNEGNIKHDSTEINNRIQGDRNGKSNDYDSTKVEEGKLDMNNHLKSKEQKSFRNKNNRNIKGQSNKNIIHKTERITRPTFSKKKKKVSEVRKSPGISTRKKENIIGNNVVNNKDGNRILSKNIRKPIPQKSHKKIPQKLVRKPIPPKNHKKLPKKLTNRNGYTSKKIRKPSLKMFPKIKVKKADK